MLNGEEGGQSPMSGLRQQSQPRQPGGGRGRRPCTQAAWALMAWVPYLPHSAPGPAYIPTQEVLFCILLFQLPPSLPFPFLGSITQTPMTY